MIKECNMGISCNEYPGCDIGLVAHDECTCGNPEFGFDCTCDHTKKYPGNIEFSCDYCGIYTASKPKCNKCESEVCFDEASCIDEGDF